MRILGIDPGLQKTVLVPARRWRGFTSAWPM